MEELSVTDEDTTTLTHTPNPLSSPSYVTFRLGNFPSLKQKARSRKLWEMHQISQQTRISSSLDLRNIASELTLPTGSGRAEADQSSTQWPFQLSQFLSPSLHLKPPSPDPPHPPSINQAQNKHQKPPENLALHNQSPPPPRCPPLLKIKTHKPYTIRE